MACHSRKIIPGFFLLSAERERANLVAMNTDVPRSAKAAGTTDPVTDKI